MDNDYNIKTFEINLLKKNINNNCIKIIRNLIGNEKKLKDINKIFI